MSQKSYDGKPSLYLIPTPIGNMEDITLRSINILKEVEVIFSEDTRVTGQLLSYLNISKKLISNHKHNEFDNKEKLISYLEKGYSVGLVSDRGTPVISDPGYFLAEHAIKNNFNVISLPGATAFVCALINSGIQSDRFTFYGFLSNKPSKRKKELQELINVKNTLIFYEATHRIVETLEDMKSIMGDRMCSISREITKKFEEIYRGTISDVLLDLTNVKGEFVIILEGNKKEFSFEDISLKEHIEMYIADGYSSKDAIKAVSKERNLSKNDVYMEYHGGD